MNRLVSHAVLAVAVTLLMPLSAHAQAFRAYLSYQGTDNPTCGVSNPCRLLPAALNAVADNGEIWMLDSANFNTGTVTINKNVIIQAIPGQMGSIAPSNGTPAMSINAGLTVTLRNISMVTSAAAPGTSGIVMTTGMLTVEDCVFEVRGLGSTWPGGVAIETQGGKLWVRNSVFRHGGTGIRASGGASVEVDNSKFDDMGHGQGGGGGLVVVGSSIATRLTVSDSHFVGSYYGLLLPTEAGNSVTATLSGSSFTHNVFGVLGQATSTGSSVLISGSRNNISNNQVGIDLYAWGSGATAVFEGLGGNIVRNNGTNTQLEGPGASITSIVPL